jgi:hypothetical protein
MRAFFLPNSECQDHSGHQAGTNFALNVSFGKLGHAGEKVPADIDEQHFLNQNRLTAHKL